MQTLLPEVEMPLKTRPLTYVYSDKIENDVTPNHLLIGRTLSSISDQNTLIQFRVQNITAQGKKVNLIINLNSYH